MTIELAMRLMEIMLGLCFIQQSCEYLRTELRTGMRALFLSRIICSAMLIANIMTPVACIGLCIISILILHRFNGPYNGGSDRMGNLILFCLTIGLIIPAWQEYALGYLALQLILSYFISGWVKLINPAWRSGQALIDVFAFSAYPVSESLRGWQLHPKLLQTMSWAVILFELAFPLLCLTQTGLYLGLFIAAIFHFTNACLFGLNRFFWIWITAYPAILWFYDRIF